MNRHPQKRFLSARPIQTLALAAGLALPLAASAALISLATAPLATSTTTSVKPNVFLMMDDSGSMGWDYMPDDVGNFSGNYGYATSQCNGIYYDPTITYLPPVNSTGTSYANSSFTGAWTDGYNTGSGSTDLRTNFSTGGLPSGPAFYFTYSGAQTSNTQKNYYNTSSTFYQECNSAPGSNPGEAVFQLVGVGIYARLSVNVSGTGTSTVSGITVNGNQIMSSSVSGGSTTTAAIPSSIASAIASSINACYSSQTGSCTTTGYRALASDSTLVIVAPSIPCVPTITPSCMLGTTPTISLSGSMTVGTTAFVYSGVGGTDERTNFANWYSYYRTRILMMKTATGLAFNPIGNNYRVGFATMNNNGGSKFLNLATFDSTQRALWYTMLYSTSAGSSTPLLGALADVGKMYAGKLTSKNGVTVTDPVQYSCQQNFTILTTDGFWNSQTGDTIVDGSTAVGNQDGTAGRPMYDGAQAATTTTTTYTQHKYSTSTSGLGSDAKCPTYSSSPKSSYRVIDQLQTQSCSVTGGTTTCTSWSNSGSAVYCSTPSCSQTYTSSTSTCVRTSSSSGLLPGVNPSTKVAGTSVTTTGSSGGTSNTLSDVAMYYYQTDLRTTALGNCTGSVAGENVCTNNVFTSTLDNNTQQHMTTFTLGLGARGRMIYSSSYLNDTSGDYFSVKTGATADSTVSPPICSWQSNGTVCNWPIPNVSGSPENIDDLWHAAVDGRGAYFSATNPATLSASLSNALAGINSRRGAAAAAATSTLNPVSGNNEAFVASYTTVAWKGNLEGRGINIDTGAVNTNADWCLENISADTCSAPSTVVFVASGATSTAYCDTPNAVVCNGGSLVGTDCMVPMATACTGTLPPLVSDFSDTRTIKTANSSGTGLTDFLYANLTSTQQSYFGTSSINGLSQWATFSSGQQAAAPGANLVNYLRGQWGYEFRSSNATQLYRYREAVMGDALESQPAFIGSPTFSYTYPGYSAFVTAQASRAGTVYIGANDGMMHAFNASNGVERWAYVPSMVIPNMWALADTNYSLNHRNFVNGSAIISDICTANCSDAASAVWKTVLVAGLNGGGRGYYALDITTPTSPILLWEFTPSTGMGKIQDDDLGYSYGQPVITQKNDGTWVVLVTSGYNNTNPGSGLGYLYVLNAGSGAIISKISTGVGSTTTPSGLAKISAWNNDPSGNLVGYVYGGDLQGNIWRFDVNSSTPATIGTGSVLQFATLYSDSVGTQPQPITTTPILGLINNKRYVFVSTGKYLETGDLTTTQRQSLYSIRDDDATSTFVNPRNTLPSQTLYPNPDGSATRLSTNNPVPVGGPGCYVDYPDTGERANIDSKLVQGILIAPTIVPSNTACSPGGYGWLNYFDYKTCGATSVKSDSTIVGVNLLYVQGNWIVEVVTSTNPTPTQPPVQPNFPQSSADFVGKHTIWRELIP